MLFVILRRPYRGAADTFGSYAGHFKFPNDHKSASLAGTLVRESAVFAEYKQWRHRYPCSVLQLSELSLETFTGGISDRRAVV